ncbi:leucyl aminopeptidase family protein [Sphingomicrobium astaxanthinifaciens]|uniref:leucyl aminopeptidase family protein n=1 Tax=Sphingomicrobium astaxanthinifaciens TaxID=1227949 RepID=UPI001FCAE48D|nr:leucyl aminopeptidase family protein [Sphingomicrobium astaxanthinifaciens]MCJ7422022.1 leucyl aminopeptidase family protein [Sphingomicrobium astaxanthinifaciens]
MTDLLNADQGQDAHPIHLVDEGSFDDWKKSQPPRIRTLLEASRYTGKQGYQWLVLPGEGEDDWSVVTTVADVDDLSPWCLAKLAEELPEGRYRLAGDKDPGPAKLGWILAQHRYGRYKSDVEERGARTLLTNAPADIERTALAAEATLLVRDMIDTPTADMGPDRIEAQVREVADRFHAEVEVIKGDALEQGYPMIHAVGKAASRQHAPRLIELTWGKEDAPRLAVVGKGVAFDSGGLDIKAASGMRLMKKDMGGAAHALALALMVMGRNLPVRLHLLIPAVENAISEESFRPGDIITSRKGLTVEIDNTDAEGRLILGDALHKAGEEAAPDLLVDFATLTGAARVALGPDLPAMFATDDALAAAIAARGGAVGDDVWRMPLWEGYDEMLASGIADLSNSAQGSFAGCITAALFLKRFIPDCDWVHFDTFGWRPTAKPGRPKGGEAYGLRATFAYLEERYGP